MSEENCSITFKINKNLRDKLDESLREYNINIMGKKFGRKLTKTHLIHEAIVKFIKKVEKIKNK